MSVFLVWFSGLTCSLAHLRSRAPVQLCWFFSQSSLSCRRNATPRMNNLGPFAIFSVFLFLVRVASLTAKPRSGPHTRTRHTPRSVANGGAWSLRTTPCCTCSATRACRCVLVFAIFVFYFLLDDGCCNQRHARRQHMRVRVRRCARSRVCFAQSVQPRDVRVHAAAVPADGHHLRVQQSCPCLERVRVRVRPRSRFGVCDAHRVQPRHVHVHDAAAADLRASGD